MILSATVHLDFSEWEYSADKMFDCFVANCAAMYDYIILLSGKTVYTDAPGCSVHASVCEEKSVSVSVEISEEYLLEESEQVDESLVLTVVAIVRQTIQRAQNAFTPLFSSVKRNGQLLFRLSRRLRL